MRGPARRTSCLDRWKQIVATYLLDSFRIIHVRVSACTHVSKSSDKSLFDDFVIFLKQHKARVNIRYLR